MNRRVVGIGVAAWLLAGSAPAAQFEGIIDMTMTQGSQKTAKMSSEYFLQGDLVRMEVHNGPTGLTQGAMIYDGKRKVVIMVSNDERKLYMERPVAPDRKPPVGTPTPVPPVKTGKTQQLLGYTAEEWVKKGPTSTTTLWLTKGLGAFRALAEMEHAQRGGPSSADDLLVNQGYLPLLVVMTDAAGHEMGRMTVTKVEKKSLSASLFAPPSGYKKVEPPTGQVQPGGMPPRPAGGPVRVPTPAPPESPGVPSPR